MKVTVTRSHIYGSIRANVSKSFAQRAYAMAALSATPSRITPVSQSDDASAALQIAQYLGADVTKETDLVTMIPNVNEVFDVWNAAESGLSLRMFSAIAASLNRKIVIDGHGSLKGRPTEFITEVLSTMGAKVLGESIPLTIQGPLVPGKYGVNGSFSSQLLTGLLIAMPLLPGDSELIVINLTSKPYIDMTLQMMAQFGVEVSHDEYRVFKIKGGQKYIGTNILVEADWSGLAFVLVAGAIALGADKGRGVTVTGVQKESTQADRAIVDVLQMIGCEVDFSGGPQDGITESSSQNSVTLKSHSLKSFVFDATQCPDLIPPLCVLATQCTGVSKITGVHRLQHKESDRGQTLTTELGKMGAKIQIEGDVMTITGKQSLHGADVDGCGDHRIAMALVCAGLVAEGETSIEGAECISKSYPDFYGDIRALHGNVVYYK